MRRKREGWRGLVSRWERSGQSAAEFGIRIGTSAATLSRWRRELKESAAARDPGPALAKIVEVRPALTSAADDRFEVRLGDGRGVVVPSTFDADEAGETPLAAARRELREETGLEGVFPAGLGVDGTPPGMIGYEEHPAGSKGLHLNFAFVVDVASRELAACDEYTAVRWVDDPMDVPCPLNVQQLIRLALASPRGAASAV